MKLYIKGLGLLVCLYYKLIYEPKGLGELKIKSSSAVVIGAARINGTQNLPSFNLYLASPNTNYPCIVA